MSLQRVQTKSNEWTNKHGDIKRDSDHLDKVPHVGIECELHRGTVTTANRQNKNTYQQKREMRQQHGFVLQITQKVK